MTTKEKYIIDFLVNNSGKEYYIDIRNAVGENFDDENDFDQTIAGLKSKNWIYELDEGSTLLELNTEMRKSVSFEIEISNYLLLSTGADGGHHYISVDIEYKGQSRKLVAYFYDKNDEEKLLKKPHLKIQGDLIDEGMQYSLSLYNTIIVEEL